MIRILIPLCQESLPLPARRLKAKIVFPIGIIPQSP